MKIWVDADACPGAVKEVIFRAAERRRVETVLVANHAVPVPPSPWIRALKVADGFDVADNAIVAAVAANDLVVTADIPLAAEVLAKGAHALNPRGEVYDDDTIRQKRAMRDFMDTMRSSGVHSGGPPPFGARDKKAFADAFDRLLARYA
ncbi:MAG: YaiI/YqxD family protein [Gammaproteobacteria bacterium]|nr:YaiI/YqxD family protein [Gammaproteobacteria bacterium]MCP5200826.1 YaiI/YqxD family protein [Gammaproteobacteria bacterium]